MTDSTDDVDWYDDASGIDHFCKDRIIAKLTRERDSSRASLSQETKIAMDFQKQRNEAQTELARLRALCGDCRNRRVQQEFWDWVQEVRAAGRGDGTI